MKKIIKIEDCGYEDEVLYIDTDSIFSSSLPLIRVKSQANSASDDWIMIQETQKIISNVQSYLNTSFNLFAQHFLNIKNHRFHIKQEVIAKSGLWIAKKRYAHWIVNDNGMPVDKLEVKGLDSIRSNFPRAFRTFMKEILTDILKNIDKSVIDEKILLFKKSLPNMNIQDIAKPTSVKGISKYTSKSNSNVLMGKNTNAFKDFSKGAPAHVKAVITYNDYLKYLGLHKKYAPLYENEKIRWTYLKPNDMGFDTIAFRGYDDPPEILEFVKKNIDSQKIFEHELQSKIYDFYNAMKWAYPSESAKKMSEFFEF